MTRSFNRKIYLTLMTAITVSGFIVICTMGQSIHRQRLASKISDIPAELPSVVLTVREYNGRIGVFKGDSSTPYRIIDYDFSLLSDYDQRQLTEGITIETDRELQQFIEDIAT